MALQNTDIALATAVTPRSNWETKRQDRNMDLQYASMLEARARQDANEAQQAVQKQTQAIAALKAMPVEAPDKPKTEAYVNSLINRTIKNIKDNYNDDYAKFMLEEGDSALMQMRDSYLSSGVYASATRNKMEMDLARKALAENQNLIGSMDSSGNYQTAEKNIMDFNNGVTDSFRFRGAYDASKAKPYEYYGKTYNPAGSKFLRSSVSENDKLAYAQSTLGPEAGLDYYQKALKGKNIFYKTDTIEDANLYNLDISEKKASINQKNASAAESYADAQKKATDAQDPIKNNTYFQTQLNQVMGKEASNGYNPAAPGASTVIQGIGVRVADLATADPGQAPRIIMNKFSNLKGDDRANQSIGVNSGTRNGQKVLYSRE